uniref:CPSF_A domain-containing protein n=1 Tax=Rhabditophanes sp. KR3021 TaxID=114890 RepID=A0AC35TN16_9BILA
MRIRNEIVGDIIASLKPTEAIKPDNVFLSNISKCSAAIKSVMGSFMGTDVVNIAMAFADRIEILEWKDGNLVIVRTHIIFDRIASMNTIKRGQKESDLIFFITETMNYTIFGYDSNGGLNIVKTNNVEKFYTRIRTGGIQSNVCRKSGRIAIIGFDSALYLVDYKERTEKSEAEFVYPPTDVKDFQFVDLDGQKDSRVVFLKETEGNTSLVLYEFDWYRMCLKQVQVVGDIGLNVYTIYVPPERVGNLLCVVTADDGLYYVSHEMVVTKNDIPRIGDGIVKAVSPVSKSGDLFFFIDGKGNVFSSKVESDKIETSFLGRSGIARDIFYLGNGIFFVTSFTTNHILMCFDQIEQSAVNGMKILKQMENSGPISSIEIAHRFNQKIIVAACGMDHDGSLRIYSFASSIKRLWSFSQKGLIRSFVIYVDGGLRIVTTGINETKMYEMKISKMGQEYIAVGGCEPVTLPHLDSKQTTYFAGLCGSFFVQICKNGIKSWHKSDPSTYFANEEYKFEVNPVVCQTSESILVVGREKCLLFYKSSEAEFGFVSTHELENQILSIDTIDVADEGFLLVTFYNSVGLYKYKHAMDEVTVEPHATINNSGVYDIFASSKFMNFGKKPNIVVAHAFGKVSVYSFDNCIQMCELLYSEKVADCDVQLINWRKDEDGCGNILASSTSWILKKVGNEFTKSNINLDKFLEAYPIDDSDLGHWIVRTTVEGISIGELQDREQLNILTMELHEDTNKVIYDKKFDSIVVTSHKQMQPEKLKVGSGNRMFSTLTSMLPSNKNREKLAVVANKSDNKGDDYCQLLDSDVAVKKIQENVLDVGECNISHITLISLRLMKPLYTYALEEREFALCMARMIHPVHKYPLIVIGTVIESADDPSVGAESALGRILCFRICDNSESNLQLVAQKCTKSSVCDIGCMENGDIVAACQNVLRVFVLDRDNIINQKAATNCFLTATAIKIQKDLIFVGDDIRSITVLRLNGDKLELFMRNASPMGFTAISFLDKERYIHCLPDRQLHILRSFGAVSILDNTITFKTTSEIILEQQINCIVKGSIYKQTRFDNKHLFSPVILGSADGGLISMHLLSEEMFQFLSAIQKMIIEKMDMIQQPEAFVHNILKYHPANGTKISKYIHGRIFEHYLSMPESKRENMFIFQLIPPYPGGKAITSRAEIEEVISEWAEVN